MAGRQSAVARDRIVAVRIEPGAEETLAGYARAAGLADGRGDGISALLRESALRFGSEAARALAAEASGRRPASPRRRRGAGSEAAGKNATPPDVNDEEVGKTWKRHPIFG